MSKVIDGIDDKWPLRKGNRLTHVKRAEDWLCNAFVRFLSGDTAAHRITFHKQVLLSIRNVAGMIFVLKLLNDERHEYRKPAFEDHW